MTMEHIKHGYTIATLSIMILKADCLFICT